MSQLVFVLLQLAFWGATVYWQWSLIWPALITGIWLIGLIRTRNIARTRDRKEDQISQCAAALNVPQFFVDNYLEKPEWLQRESYNDVHPGRIADELAKEYLHSSGAH
ncbi:hypothetical protein K0504_08455 [Neiella marina]|uniref:Uncharacterized protein n=1 Tax=Neiella holothuriorum TaxID=2870530 RepID=A0ABS7EHA5_9GAMM|nr:hypothetical protein [Neiella holothuriorum]MBW8191062.1 hypothetical protein [Neiella holothuriorum]